MIAVMHIVDTLQAGGAERVAVNLVNFLPRDRFRPYLCATRQGGPLEACVAPDVIRLSLGRRWRFDVDALRRFLHYLSSNDIRLLHAHGTSVFLAALASCFPPHPAVVWHDHYGRCGLEERPAWLYRFVARKVSQIIAVNDFLVEWSRFRLRFRPEQVCYLPNFVALDQGGDIPKLPGAAGTRIVCLANLRPQKDHLTLVRAMSTVVQQAPGATLLLVGGAADPVQLARVGGEITALGLESAIIYLGERSDTAAILRGCDVGVLSSASEGLPLALLEYGAARLASVATRVGQCPEVVDEGRAGVLVAPGCAAELAEAILKLLRSPALRQDLGNCLHRRVQEHYSAGAVIQQLCSLYDAVLTAGHRERSAVPAESSTPVQPATTSGGQEWTA